jgi:hypothetical protein
MASHNIQHEELQKKDKKFRKSNQPFAISQLHKTGSKTG